MSRSPGPGNHSYLACGECQTLLMYPTGSPSVRCQRCQHVNRAPPVADSLQISCRGCQVLLAYPRGAESVRCSLCSSVTQVPRYSHLVCGSCNITLMYQVDASSVKCAVCHYVTPVGAPNRGAQAGHGAKPSQTVVIENPPSDPGARHSVKNIAVGVKAEKQ